MKYIKGYERLYSITEDGKVWSHYKNRFLTPRKNIWGYLMVSLYKDGTCKQKGIHRLVAETYIPNPKGLSDVNHKDENKENNCVDNLEWMTHKANCNYGSFTIKRKKRVYCVELDKIFESGKEAAEELGLNKGNISSCCTGRYKTTGGYHFRYIDIEEVKGDK